MGSRPLELQCFQKDDPEMGTKTIKKWGCRTKGISEGSHGASLDVEH